jgi:hypothetical protein
VTYFMSVPLMEIHFFSIFYFHFSKNFKTEIDEDITETLTTDDDKKLLIYSLASLHDLLCSTVSLINFCFSIAIALYIGANLISVIFALLILYRLLISSTATDEAITYCVLYNSWKLILSMFALAVVCVCSWSKREAKSTIMILHKALHYQDSESVLVKVNKLFQ